MSGPLARLGVLLLAAGLFVGGCKHLPLDGDGLTFEQRRARLEALPGWEMRGRLAVDTGDGAYQASFRWRKQDDFITLTVRGGLFGAGVMEVSGTDEQLLVRARGDSWLLGDPERELSEILGWWVPVASLHAWLLGLPDRGFDARLEVGANEALETLEQRLWSLSYDSYQLSEGLLLPRRIDMRHGRMELRVTVDGFGPAAALSGALN